MDGFGIQDKIKKALSSSEYDALLVTGADNVQYLSGGAPPFLSYRPDLRLMVYWPRNGVPSLICPLELESAVRQLGRIRRVHPYGHFGNDPVGAAAVVAGLARSLPRKGDTLGIDTDCMPLTLLQALEEALPGVRLVACDEWLRELRVIKTEAEMALLEEVAYTTDHGLNGSLHHVVVASPRTQLTEAEEIRVHCLERGLVETGYHSAAQVAGGPGAQKLLPLCPLHGINYGYSSTVRLEAGQLVRLSMRATQHGYWSDAGRILVMGQPSPEQASVYRDLVWLREALMDAIRPGVLCSEVFQAAVDEATGSGIDLLPKLGLGHGVGVSAEEAPYLTADDATILQAGMVLVLEPVVRGPEAALLGAKDTVVVTETGCRLVGWWKDWREPYIPIQII